MGARISHPAQRMLDEGGHDDLIHLRRVGSRLSRVKSAVCIAPRCHVRVTTRVVAHARALQAALEVVVDVGRHEERRVLLEVAAEHALCEVDSFRARVLLQLLDGVRLEV